MAQPTCFHEADPLLALHRRALAEGLGTLLLVLAACGGGLAAAHDFAEPGFVLPLTAISIAGALVGLIVAFGPVSGGHFNPLITILQWLAGERPRGCMIAYVGAQLAGGLAGGLLAAALWRASPVTAGHGSLGGFASEAVASAGLMLIVFGCSRGGRANAGPFAVGAWLIAAIVATPTASYANPAVVVGALASAGPVALTIGAAPAFVVAELLGALVAFWLVLLVFPQRSVSQ